MRKTLWAGLAIALLAGCARFHAQPLSVAKNLDAFESRTLSDPGLKSFLETNHSVAEWPPKSWDLMSLTLVAFYYHPDIEDARAALTVARSGILTAGQRPNPTATLSPQFNSTTPEAAGISPWILAFNLDIPIETAGKRGHRITQAEYLAEAARLNVATAAWQVRSRVRRSLLDLYAATEIETLLKAQRAILEDNARLMKLQLDAGAVSPFEVSQANIALATTRLALDDAAKKRAEARAALADAVGLTVQALDGVAISFDAFKEAPPEIPTREARREALTNRADILSALFEYEAAQAALQLEIAKQYPDIHLNPGYEFDQSEHKWGVGLSLDLPILNQNRGPIAEAEAKRKQAATKFNALQARVVGDIERAMAAYGIALQKSKTAAGLVTDLRKREQAAMAMFKAGEIPKLEVATTQIELRTNEIAFLNAGVEAQQSLGLLEDAMQRPADRSNWQSRIPEKALEPSKRTGDAESPKNR